MIEIIKRFLQKTDNLIKDHKTKRKIHKNKKIAKDNRHEKIKHARETERNRYIDWKKEK